MYPTTHGGSNERLYNNVWLAMLARCEKENHPAYYLYGIRGISVCKEWHDYSIFRDWANSTGYDPNAKRGMCTIDRVDNDGNYEPSNCKWSTMKEQSKNKRRRYDYARRE